MTPFPTDGLRTATIELSKQEEKLIRDGISLDASRPLYSEVVIEKILEKLRKSLELQDLLGPMASIPQFRPEEMLDF